MAEAAAIPWGRIADEHFSLKSAFRAYGGFGTREPKEVREDGSKLVWSTDSRICANKRCGETLLPSKVNGEMVYLSHCKSCRAQGKMRTYEAFPIGKVVE